MKPRILRNIFSAATLGAFAILAAGTSRARPNPLGEFPLGLQVHGDLATLLHFTNGPFEAGPRTTSRLVLSTLSPEGTVTTLQDIAVPAVDEYEIAGAVSASSTGAMAFAIASSSHKGPYTIVVSGTGDAQTVPFGTGGRRMPFSRQVSIIGRDSSRQWVFFNQAFDSNGSAFLPLFEIENGVATLLADNVVWARCDKSWCQQVRIEGSSLRLYANPATSDLYNTAVTDADARGFGHSTYTDPYGIPVLVFGGNEYALSTTEPSLLFKEKGAVENRVENGSGYPSYPGPRGYRSEEPLSGNFSNGYRMTVRARVDNNPDASYCDADCSENHEVYETWIEISDAYSIKLRAFPLHDY